MMDISGYVNAIRDYPMESVDGAEVLNILYEHYMFDRKTDSKEIREAYSRLYEKINHMPIREISLIEWPLNELVTQFEMRGFKEGVKVGIKLAVEIDK